MPTCEYDIMKKTLDILLLVTSLGLCLVNSASTIAAEPQQRSMRYTHRPKEEAAAWQKQVRAELWKVLKIDDLRTEKIPLGAEILSTKDMAGYTMHEVRIRATATRTIPVALTIPKKGTSPFPAVVCIHGHGGNRHVVYDPKTIYKGFAAKLAEAGVVTIAADVGQHDLHDTDRTLIGERLWDLIRCVDYLASRSDVDARRIGCAGLSLGGEMAMWLGAMDTRIVGTVSAGFLTVMDQMEQNHCMCWKFPGLRERVDYADIYSLIAPRGLQCQNGRKEPPTQFTVELARTAMREIQYIYADFRATPNLGLVVHDGAHEIDLPSLMAFFRNHLHLDRP